MRDEREKTIYADKCIKCVLHLMLLKCLSKENTNGSKLKPKATRGNACFKISVGRR
jgi:hypothetical protein